MSNINILKNKLKRLVLFVLAAVSLGVVFQEVEAYPHIPLRGLFNVLKKDDIGFAHALLHSGWIENMYQYGAGKPHREIEVRNRKKWKTQDKGDAVANLIRKFWFKRNENHQLLPTQYGCLAHVPNNQLGKVFGQLINAVYKGLPQEDQDLLIDMLVPYDQNFEQYHQELAVLWRKLIDQEYALKHDEKFEQIKLANVRLQEEIARLQLQEKFNMTELNRQIAQVSKVCKKSKDLNFKEEKKKIESEFDRIGYQRAFKEAKQRIFSGLEEKLDQYEGIKAIVRNLQAAIEKKVRQKRNIIKKELLLPITKSLKLCKTGEVYMPRSTEGILWALFFHKIDALSSQEEKVQAIKDCLDCIDQQFKNDISLDAFYSIKEIEDFEKKIKKLKVDKQTEEIFLHYDLALHTLIAKRLGAFSPEISEGHFGYEYEKGKISKTRHNCYETTMHDFFSLLWYNPKIKRYDDLLFSSDILQNGQGFKRFRESLKLFYLADEKNIKAKEYTIDRGTSLLILKDLGKISAQEIRGISSSDIPVSYVNRSVIKQEFMNIVSGIPGVDYCTRSRGKERDFELDTNVKNFILVCNYFYGITCENLDDLGKAISTQTREITFEKQDDKDTPNKIKVSVYDKKNDTYLKIIIYIKQNHADISVPARDQMVSKIVKKGVIEKLLGNLGDSKSLALFTLLSSKAFLGSKKTSWSLPIANLVYYALGMQGNQSKLAIMRHAFKILPQYYNSWKGMVCNLIDMFPLNDYFLGEDLRRILVSKYYPHWSDFIEVVLERGYTEIAWSIVNHEGFYKGVGIGMVLQVVMRKEFPDMALRILKDPQFEVSGYGMGDLFSLALRKEYRDIALKIINNKKFKISEYSVVEALLIALSKGYRDIVSKLAKDPAFSPDRYGIEKILVHALEKSEYNYIAVMILESPKFEHWMLAVKYALKRGNKKIALQIIEHVRCDVNRYGAADALLFALEKGYLDIILSIINKKSFDFSKYWVGIILVEAMAVLRQAKDERCKEVVQKIVENPEFKCWGRAFVYALRYHKDIALKILQYPQFNGWQAGVQYAMKGQKNKDIITILLSDPRCDLSGDGLGDLLGLAIKKGYGQVVSAIAKILTFESIEKKLVKILRLAIEKEYKDIALIIAKMLSKKGIDNCLLNNYLSEAMPLVLVFLFKEVSKEAALNIFEHPKFRLKGSSVIFALERGYYDIADILFKNPKFNTFASFYSKIFWLAIQNYQAKDDRYMDLALAIVRHPNFKASKCCSAKIFLFAMQEGHQEIGLRVINNPLFDAAESGIVGEYYDSEVDYILLDGQDYNEEEDVIIMEGAFKWALKRGYREIVFKVINHPTFDTAKPWVKRVLIYVKKLLEEKPEGGLSTGLGLQEVIETIEHKQSKKDENNGYSMFFE